jgi:hypothetical protein
VPPCRMADVTVRLLGEEDWSTYRAVRLAALAESPEAFGSDLEDEAAAPDDHWRAAMTAARRLVVELDGRVCGVVSVGRPPEEPALATAEGAERLYYWVGTENARAIGFAISSGFRVTSHRRPAVGAGDGPADDGDTEIALVLPLEEDASTVPNAGDRGSYRPAAGSGPDGE